MSVVRGRGLRAGKELRVLTVRLVHVATALPIARR
jgi:hypothetical protein